MAFKYEKEFRKDNPQTIGETDKVFDLDNYKDWLETELEHRLSLIDDLYEDVEMFSDLKFNGYGHRIVELKSNNLTK